MPKTRSVPCLGPQGAYLPFFFSPGVEENLGHLKTACLGGEKKRSAPPCCCLFVSPSTKYNLDDPRTAVLGGKNKGGVPVFICCVLVSPSTKQNLGDFRLATVGGEVERSPTIIPSTAAARLIWVAGWPSRRRTMPPCLQKAATRSADVILLPGPKGKSKRTRTPGVFNSALAAST
jgi:hypothetical protein